MLFLRVFDCFKCLKTGLIKKVLIKSSERWKLWLKYTLSRMFFSFLAGEGRLYYLWQVRRTLGIFPKAVSLSGTFLFFIYFFRAALQASSQIGAIAAGLHHSHNMGSEPRL